jgi:thiol-disulfide isomerase/thioredoxin
MPFVMTDEIYKNLQLSDVNIIIDTWADWCSPCKQMKPMFEEAERLMKNSNVVFYTLNVEDYEDLADELDIINLPTFVLIKNKTYYKHDGKFDSLENMINFISK